MTATTQSLRFASPFAKPSRGPMDLGLLTRALIIVTGSAMSAACLFALGRGLLGYAPHLPQLRNAAIMLHVATVLPCVPLGLYLFLGRKGTARHKQLGKLWLALMVITATSTLFIHNLGTFSWIHIFVPFTYRAAWLVVSKARRGDIRGHRNELLGMFLGALMIPGLFAFVIEGRLMNLLLG